LTVNGKADTAALPQARPLGTLVQHEERELTETETAVRELFAEALDLDEDEVGMTSGFTDLGGMVGYLNEYTPTCQEGGVQAQGRQLAVA